MKIIKKIITWFNGKKTIIGLLGLSILQMDLQIIASLGPDVKTIALWAFGLLASGGLIHKGLKK